METTTIKIRKNTKHTLDTIRIENESYDETIQRILKEIKNKELKKQLIEAYKNMGHADLEILEEWENASLE